MFGGIRIYSYLCSTKVKNQISNNIKYKIMKTTTATPQITAAAVVRALAQSFTLASTYCAQRTAAALRAAHRATIAARIWLRASHEFYGQDGDPIKCTGWQFVGYNLIAAIVALLLCIRF